ncbi:MAG: DUF2330 domain-containing protein [Polyangiaceae bacterium]
MIRGTWLLLLCAFLLVQGGDARACAPAPHRGEFVEIADEEALILWDAKNKVQHFVRRAEFRTRAKDFGFLVPTPTQPQLGEVDDDLFRRLAQRVAPEVRYEEKRELEFGCLFMASKSETAATAGDSVRVLDAMRVAGLDATVLEADSASALAEWLKQHDYDKSPELVGWLEPYVQKKWKVTAFKLAKDADGAPELATKAVRMTFPTDRPFFPYREPANQRGDKRQVQRRLLRTYLVAPTRMEGTLAAAQGFPGQTRYARALPDAAALLVEPLLVSAAGTSPWLTEIVDESSPRPGVDDVFFAAAKETAEVVPPVKVVTVRKPITIPLELVGVGLVLGLVAMAVAIVVLRRRSAP